MPKYSFIVPVYNTEIYLRKCLSSLVNQTYKNYEIVVVNDGSTDSSSKIIDDYVKKYKNIKVVNQKNQGLSVARNNGVKETIGDYILFIDSDDYVDERLLENIDLKIDNVDVLRYQIATDNNNNIKEYNEKAFDNVSGDIAFKYLSSYHFVELACCYVIKSKYYKENEFNFEKGVYHEDFGLIPYIIYKANKVKSIDYIGYYYVTRDGSIMNNTDYQKTIKKAFDMLKQYKKMKIYSRNANKKINLDDYYLSYISNSVIVKARELKPQDRKKYVTELKKINAFDGILVDTKMRKLKKILMKSNLNLYLKIVR